MPEDIIPARVSSHALPSVIDSIGRSRRPNPMIQRGNTEPSTKFGQVRALLSSGMSASEIAKKVGCSVNLVYGVKSTAARRRAWAWAPAGSRRRKPEPSRITASGGRADQREAADAAAARAGEDPGSHR